jgi:hypothetical protein
MLKRFPGVLPAPQPKADAGDRETAEQVADQLRCVDDEGDFALSREAAVKTVFDALSLARQSAPQSPAKGKVEPVAWRWRGPSTSYRWSEPTDSKVQMKAVKDIGAEVEALIPASALSDREAEIERLRTAYSDAARDGQYSVAERDAAIARAEEMKRGLREILKTSTWLRAVQIARSLIDRQEET